MGTPSRAMTHPKASTCWHCAGIFTRLSRGVPCSFCKERTYRQFQLPEPVLNLPRAKFTMCHGCQRIFNVKPALDKLAERIIKTVRPVPESQG